MNAQKAAKVNNSQVKPAKVNVRKLAKLNPQKKILR
jgi:hypothetical protein